MLWLGLSALILPVISASAALDEYSGNGFQYFDQKDRVKTVRRLCEDLENNYALWELKKELVGLDSKAHCRALIAAEEAVGDPDPKDTVAQAKANLAFFDRVKKFGAGFKDTHFSIRTTGPRSMIYLPLTVRKVDGKYLVTGRSQKLLQHIAQFSGGDSVANISIGDELVEFNGKPVASEVTALIPYQSQGTEQGAEMRAIDAMFSRDYAYPSSPIATLTLKSAADEKVQKVEMSWIYRDPKRRDEKVYFDAIGFKDVTDLRRKYDSESKKWIIQPLFDEEYVPSHDMGKNLRDVREYLGFEEKESAIRKGLYVSGGKTFGVLQVFTFSEEFVTTASASGTAGKEAFLDVIRSTVIDFKTMGVPLILDLRENGGGDSSYPAKVLSMLTPKGNVYPGATRAFRVTHYVRSTHDNLPHLIRESLGRELTGGVSDEELIELLNQAVKTKSSLTQAYSDSGIQPDPEVAGFEAPIVALISPNCVSACDMMATLLKSSGRAVILGTNTSGTGAGFTFGGDYSRFWKDGLQIFTTSIPNFLFGAPGGPAGQKFFPGQAKALCTENRPTVADIRYETTLSDVKNGDLGWLQKAVEAIGSPKKAKID